MLLCREVVSFQLSRLNEVTHQWTMCDHDRHRRKSEQGQTIHATHGHPRHGQDKQHRSSAASKQTKRPISSSPSDVPSCDVPELVRDGKPRVLNVIENSPAKHQPKTTCPGLANPSTRSIYPLNPGLFQPLPCRDEAHEPFSSALGDRPRHSVLFLPVIGSILAGHEVAYQ